MKYNPVVEQQQALKFAKNKKIFGLFILMGVGKTSVSLTLIEELMYNLIDIRRVLVVAPLRVAEITWPDEIRKWDHTRKLSYTFIHGPKKLEKLKAASDIDITLINFDGLSWLEKHRRHSPRYDMLIVDESTYIKAPKTGRTKALHTLSRFIPRKIILSGKPSPNSIEDFWSQIFVLDRGQRLGANISSFRDRYMVPGFVGSRKTYYPKKGADKEILKKISDIVMVIDNDNIRGIPSVKDNIIKFDLSKKIRKNYEELESKFFTEIAPGEEVIALSKPALTQKLRQFITGFVYQDNHSISDIHNERLKILEELAESVNDNLLVAINYKEEVRLIQEHFGKSIPFINSQTKRSDTALIIKKWNARKIPMLLAHPRSLAHGMNLQSGSRNIVWFNLPHFSYEEWAQFIARLARRGQSANYVMNHVIIAKDTIDEAIYRIVNNKGSNQKRNLDILKKWRERHEERHR
jgi:hypothetical protein